MQLSCSQPNHQSPTAQTMKKYSTKYSVLAAVATVALLALAPPAPAQNLLADPYTLTNLPSVITPGGVSNITSTPITVRQGNGLAFYTYIGTATNSGYIWLGFDTTPDGTNYTTTQPLWMAVPCFTTSGGSRHVTNFAANLLTSAYKIQLSRITNATGTNCYLTNIICSRAR
jgi:hypothetical protein